MTNYKKSAPKITAINITKQTNYNVHNNSKTTRDTASHTFSKTHTASGNLISNSIYHTKNTKEKSSSSRLNSLEGSSHGHHQNQPDKKFS